MRLCLLIAGQLLLLTASTVGADEPPFRRWAVIATPAVDKSGASDLLTVELSQDESVELVERERLREATRELQLAALITAGNVEQRLQLGKTLGADALMVLSIEQQQGKRWLRVVVCGAYLGVRLWDGSFAFEDAKLDDLVKHCASTVTEVRQRFAGGIKHIIAVPPFLSEDFEIGFAYLQSRYRERLSSALTSRAGVAVVELEEARAILRELEDTLSGGLERPIATFVKGSFRTRKSSYGKTRTVDVKIELTAGDEQQETIEKTFALGSVGNWLTQTLSKRLLDASNNRAPSLSPETQKTILLQHASRFAELGDWQRSTSLREAALALDPTDGLQRAVLLREYQFGIDRDVAFAWSRNRPADARERGFRRATHDHLTGLAHLEYLVRNESVGRVDAVGLFYTHRWYRLHAVGPALPHDPLAFDVLGYASRAHRKFISEVGPLILALPDGRKLPKQFSEEYYGWQFSAYSHVVSDLRFHSYNPESLVSLEELITKLLPESAKTTDYLMSVFSYGSNYAKDFSPDAWSKLLDRLASSDHELAEVYGRWGLLCAARRQRQLTLEQMVELSARLKELKRTDGPLFARLEELITAKRNRATRPTTPYKPKLRYPDDYLGLGRVQLEPIWVHIAGEEDERPPLIKGMRRCGAKCDAYWTLDRFFLMHEPGVLQELKLTDATADHILFWGATWDGACLWIHVHGAGIVAVDPNSKQVTTFRQDNIIPGYDKGFKLVGLSPRHTLMIGSFGEANRAWCAILKVDENGKPSAEVFFEAKFVANGRPKDVAEADPQTAFQPERVYDVTDAAGKRYVLVSRSKLKKKLRIDPATRRVSVASVPKASTRTELGFRGRSFIQDGKFLSSNSPKLSESNARQLVYHDGWLYALGHVWYRSHVETGKLERLQPGFKKMPTNYWNARSGVSAHYGLVIHRLYNRRPPLYRVTIADEPAKESAQ
jgi:hypothetical protein